jgi:hypothetical protein
VGFAGLTLVVIGGTSALAWVTDRVYHRLDRRSSARPVPAVGPISA